MSYYPELDALSLSQLKKEWESQPIEGTEYALSFYDEIAFILVQKFDQEGISFLLEQLDIASVEQLASILRFLPLPVGLVESYLSNSSPLIISRAIEQLGERNEKKFIDDILQLYQHKDSWVRSSVLRAMSQLNPDEAVALLIEALHDSSPLVRQSAIDELDELEATDAVPDISKLLGDPDEDVRIAAKTALSNLSNV